MARRSVLSSCDASRAVLPMKFKCVTDLISHLHCHATDDLFATQCVVPSKSLEDVVKVSSIDARRTARRSVAVHGDDQICLGFDENGLPEQTTG